MKSPAGCLAFAAILAVCATSVAADPATPPAPIPAVELKSGRVLHNVRILSDEPDSLVLRADEGLVKVRKADLPADLAAKYPARAAPPETYAAPPLTLSQPAPVPQPTKPPAKPVRKTGAEFVTVFKGCTIVGFQPKPFQSAQGAVEVRIHNDSETPVDIFPKDIVGMDYDGNAHVGHFLVAVPENGASIVKRHDSVAANGDLVDLVVFSNEELKLATIRWAQRQ